MNKSIIVAGLCTALLFTGCGADKTVSEGPVNEEKEIVVVESPGELEKTDEEKTDVEESSRLFWNTQLPEGIEIVSSEKEKNEALEKLIIDEFEIPEDMLENTRYYYNYVDLNADGKEEIFVVVMGMYTSGTGGDSALIVYPVEDKLYVNQRFTLINEPVIISDTMTNGAKEIIVFRAGGGAKGEFVALTCHDGEYDSVNDGIVIDSIDDVKGRAIIANDILKDMESGEVLTLKSK